MKAKNREEAWRKADRMFPTDYQKDDIGSEKAGYPIYTSTLEGNMSWISDLGNRLELNIENEDGDVESVNIWINEEPEIVENKILDADDVRVCCVMHKLYTAGTCRAYDNMLNMTNEEDFSLNLLYRIAKDITDHSEDQTIENVMFLLNRDAVRTFYHIG